MSDAGQLFRQLHVDEREDFYFQFNNGAAG